MLTALSGGALPLAEAALGTLEASFGLNPIWTKDSACVAADVLDALKRHGEAAALRARMASRLDTGLLPPRSPGVTTLRAHPATARIPSIRQEPFTPFND